jgi:hypothetical protein
LAEAVLALMRQGFRTISIRDRHFIFSLLSVVMAISFVLSTVYLGAQSYEVLFFIIGWSQSIRAIRRTDATVETRIQELTAAPALMRVYT